MILVFLASVVLLVAWWLTGRLASRDSPYFILDHPNERSLHLKPTPCTGGLAIMGSFLVGVVGTAFSWYLMPSTMRVSLPHGWRWIVGMTVLVASVSFLDDRRGVAVWLRLSVHIIAASGVVLGGGLALSTVAIPLVGAVELGWFAPLVAVLFLVWMANLYNFMDGMDGFAGGMTVIGCGLLGYLGWQAHHPVISVIATLQSAAAAGFLVHNFPPAKIFMGDVGSVSTGFLVAALVVLGCRDGVFDLWVPLIVFSPFILDATVTLVRRAFRHEKVWEAHRDHFYQRLVLGGWGHRRTVLAEYGVMILCGGFALLYQYASEEWRLVILGFWGALFFSLALAVKGVEQRIQSVGS